VHAVNFVFKSLVILYDSNYLAEILFKSRMGNDYTYKTIRHRFGILSTKFHRYESQTQFMA